MMELLQYSKTSQSVSYTSNGSIRVQMVDKLGLSALCCSDFMSYSIAMHF